MQFRSLSFPTVSHPASPNYIKLTASEAEKKEGDGQKKLHGTNRDGELLRTVKAGKMTGVKRTKSKSEVSPATLSKRSQLLSLRERLPHQRSDEGGLRKADSPRHPLKTTWRDSQRNH